MNNELNFDNNKPQVQFEPQNYNLSFDAPKTSGGGTSDYEKLKNLPTINNVEVKGNLTSEDLGITDIELIPEIKPESIEEDLKPNQVYNGNAIHDLARLFGMTLEELTKTLPVLLTEFDIEKTYEDNEVYNANSIHQLLEMFVWEITQIQDYVAENVSEPLKEFDIGKTYADKQVYNANVTNLLVQELVRLIEAQAIFDVFCTISLSAMRVTNISQYSERIIEEHNKGKIVRMNCSFAENPSLKVSVLLNVVEGNIVNFYPIILADLGNGFKPQLFRLWLNKTNGYLSAYTLAQDGDMQEIATELENLMAGLTSALNQFDTRIRALENKIN